MANGRNGPLWAGIIILIAAVLLPIAMFAGGDVGSVVVGFIFLFLVSPILFVLGLVFLIVGLARGRGGGQQQQQQVVVVSGEDFDEGAFGAAGQARSRLCVECGMSMAATAQFCTRCGRHQHG